MLRRGEREGEVKDEELSEDLLLIHSPLIAGIGRGRERESMQ